MSKILLTLFILAGFTVAPTFATQQINYLAGHPISVTYGSGHTRSLLDSSTVTTNYATPRRYITTPVYRPMAMTRPVRRLYYGTTKLPVIVNNNIVVEPTKENPIYEPVKTVQPRTYTRDGITYYN